uniref:HAT C-terminal dimerisation domain-containing protein n=1 Tax=Heliothis virescens TaxID=7102 RepID=A0A2A4JW65_HELVI
MCHFPTTKTDEEVKPLPEEEHDADMESEEEPGEENEESAPSARIWSEIQQKNADAALLMFVIRSFQHMSIVDCLKPLMATNENYVLPDRQDIMERILPHMYSVCFNEQKANMQEAVKVCLSIEEWVTSKGESISSITGHYVNSNFELKSVLLKCCEFQAYNIEEAATFLRELCNEWDIFSKVHGCLTNRQHNFNRALNSLGWNQFKCTAFALNVILQKSLEISKPILEKVKKIAHHFLWDTKSMTMLNDYQRNVQGLEDPIEIMDSNIVHWSATYDMVEIFLSLQQALTAVVNEISSLEFTNEDWSKLNQLFKLYKPFSDATKELGDDKYVCGSTVIPIVHSLKTSLQEMDNDPNFILVKEEINCMMQELNTEYEGVERELNLAMSTILDPRYKMSKFVDGNAAEAAKTHLVTEIQNLMNVNNTTDAMKTESAEEKQEQGNSVNTENSLVLAQEEMDLYIEDDLAACDPSEWWPNNQQKYPHLAQLFKAKCSIVATSLLGGNLYTERGNNLCENRQRLSANKARYMVFLRANLKDEDDFLKVMP